MSSTESAYHCTSKTQNLNSTRESNHSPSTQTLQSRPLESSQDVLSRFISNLESFIQKECRNEIQHQNVNSSSCLSLQSSCLSPLVKPKQSTAESVSFRSKSISTGQLLETSFCSVPPQSQKLSQLVN
jgi:hypothetical protein